MCVYINVLNLNIVYTERHLSLKLGLLSVCFFCCFVSNLIELSELNILLCSFFGKYVNYIQAKILDKCH